MSNILDPGFDLNLRPMRYAPLYKRYTDAIRNTWTVDEVDFVSDPNDLALKMTAAERHMVHRLVAFFATGDSVVSNNAVLSLYRHINSPEARMFLSRQIFEEALHIQFYLTLLDTYIPDAETRAASFRAIETIPSISEKGAFCAKWMDASSKMDRLVTADDRRTFLMNLICFATCVEGLFFYGAFVYVYFLKSRGLLKGLADGTSWILRDEQGHMSFALAIVDVIRREEPGLFNASFNADVKAMLLEALECEMQFAEDVLSGGVSGLSTRDMRTYLQYVVDQRLLALGMPIEFGSKNPFNFMELQGLQGLGNMFERTVTEYQKGTAGKVSFDEAF